MSGINTDLSNTNSNYDVSKQKVKPAVSKIEIPDIDNSLDTARTVDAFKKEVSSQLGLPQDQIQLSIGKDGLKAKSDLLPKAVTIEFKDSADFSKVALATANSSNMTMLSLGDDKNTKEVHIPDYPNGLSRDEDLNRFKNDVSRELKTEQRNIEVFSADNEIVVKKKGSDDRYIVKFNDPKDQQRFLDYTNESFSRRLADIGIKKNEGEIHSGFNTNLSDPKHGTTLSTGFTYAHAIDDHQRIILNTEMAQNPSQPFSMNTLQRFDVTYQNLDVPFLGDYGEFTVRYDNGKFNGSAKSDAIDIMANDFGKKTVNGLKQGDPTTIAEVAGGVALAAGAIYLAKEYLPERKEFDIPLKARVYGDGRNKVNAIVAPTLGVGGKQLDVSMHKVGAEAEQNIASGENFRESVIYDFSKKSVKTQIRGEYNNFYGNFENNYSFEDKNLNHSTLNLGYHQIISDKTSAYYSLNQDFDKNFKPTSTYAGVGVSYRPDTHWTLNTGVNVSLPTPDAKPAVGVGASIGYRF